MYTSWAPAGTAPNTGWHCRVWKCDCVSAADERAALRPASDDAGE